MPTETLLKGLESMPHQHYDDLPLWPTDELAADAGHRLLLKVSHMSIRLMLHSHHTMQAQPQ